MNSAGILMNLAPVPVATTMSVPTTAVSETPAEPAGFGLALAAVQASGIAEGAQASVPPISPEWVPDLALTAMVSSIPAFSGGPGMDANGDTADLSADVEPAASAEDACASGAAAILAQMLLGSAPPAPPEPPAPPVSPVPADGPSAVAVTAPVPVHAAAVVAGGDRQSATARTSGAASESGTVAKPGTDDIGEPAPLPVDAGRPLLASSDQSNPDLAATVAIVAVPERPEAAPASSMTPPNSPSGIAVPLAVQSAAHALRESASMAPEVPVQATLREPVGSARWAQELGNHLVLMSARGQQQGSLSLVPEHLGPVEVQISVNKDTANVWFGAQHADTRAALTEAMPRLREMLASTGLSLGQSGVSEHAPRERFNAPVPSVSDSEPAVADIVTTQAAPTWRRWQPGLVDTYA